MEVAGVALSAVALAAAAKGIVDSCSLVAEIFQRDDDSLHLAVLYTGEKYRLQTWMDSIHVQDPAASRLSRLSEPIREHIYRMLADIETTQSKTARIIAKRCGLPPLPTKSVPTSFPQSLSASSEVQQLVALNASLPRRKRLSWSVKDKEELKKLVDALTASNNQLKDLIMPISNEMFEQSVAARVVAEIRDSSSLSIISNTSSNATSNAALTKLGMRLRELKLQTPGTAALIDIMPDKSLSIDDNGFTGTAIVDGYPLGRRVWVEKRAISAILKPEHAVLITERIRALATMLRTINNANEDVYCIPEFVGLYEDVEYVKASQGRNARWWFVYAVPSSGGPWDQLLDVDPPSGNTNFTPNPVSLATLLRHVKSQSSPPELGDRVKLALALASSFAQLHAAGWLHKGFRSDKIWFFRSKNGARDSLPDITRPFITGFDISRPLTWDSIEHRDPIEIDKEYYYHEASLDGYTKVIDLYSLGIAMFEIGRWALATKGVPKTVDRYEPKALQRFLVTKGVEDLGWRVGRRYMNVVKTLLECSIPSHSDEAVTQGFFTRVIQELDEIKV